MGPAERALRECRKRGWTAQVVERWIRTPDAARKKDAHGNPLGPPGRRIDLFGCIDILALTGCPGVLGIQVTSRSHMAERRDKARREKRISLFIERGNAFEIWGYAKKKNRWGLTRWQLDPAGGCWEIESA